MLQTMVVMVSACWQR